MATWYAVQDLGLTAQGLSNQTSFLRPIFDGTIHAVARRRHRGRTTWVWEVEITDDEDRLCALVRMTIAVREARAERRRPPAGAACPGRAAVLPNAWDAATARLVQEAGFPVVATTRAASPRRWARDARSRPSRDARRGRADRPRGGDPGTADLEGGTARARRARRGRRRRRGRPQLRGHRPRAVPRPAPGRREADADRRAQGGGRLVVRALARAPRRRHGGSPARPPTASRTGLRRPDGVTDGQIARFVALGAGEVLLSPGARRCRAARARGRPRLAGRVRLRGRDGLRARAAARAAAGSAARPAAEASRPAPDRSAAAMASRSGIVS